MLSHTLTASSCQLNFHASVSAISRSSAAPYQTRRPQTSLHAARGAGWRAECGRRLRPDPERQQFLKCDAGSPAAMETEGDADSAAPAAIGAQPLADAGGRRSASQPSASAATAQPATAAPDLPENLANGACALSTSRLDTQTCTAGEAHACPYTTALMQKL